MSHDLGLQAVNSRKTTVLGFIGFNRTLVDRVRKEKEMQIKAKRSDMVLGDKKAVTAKYESKSAPNNRKIKKIRLKSALQRTRNHV